MDVLKGAIIGFGEVARHGHWPAYATSRDAKIVAVIDPAEERRSLARRSLPEIATFSTVDELAASTQVDFVDICTPPALHSHSILAALAHGWNALCEKPLVLDQVELDKVRRAAREAERAVVPVHNWKYAPIIRKATELLRQDAIGKLRNLEIETLRVNDCAVADPDRPGWRRDPAVAGGGVLMDHGWHAIIWRAIGFRKIQTKSKPRFTVRQLPQLKMKRHLGCFSPVVRQRFSSPGGLRTAETRCVCGANGAKLGSMTIPLALMATRFGSSAASPSVHTIPIGLLPCCRT
jgi:Oxidoreductase family, NAD-binding Rossmann fold